MVGMKLIARCRRRFPVGLAGMIALVALIEAGIARHAISLFDSDELSYRWTARQAIKVARSCEILCFGDSLIKLGVVPRVVGERAGKTAFNLAVSGSQAPASYFLLRRALASGARPAAIVCGFTPPLLRVGPRHNLARWPGLLDPTETAALAWWAGDPLLFGEITVDQVLPSLRGKATIRAKIREGFGGAPFPLRFGNTYNIRNWRRNDGAQLMTGSAVRGLTDADVAQVRTGYYPEWRTHPANLAGIDHFLALAEQAGVPVFWILPPLLPALHDQLTASGFAARYEAFVRDWQAKYPRLVVLDARGRITDLDAFWDVQHLSVAGAAAFSRVLGEIIRDHLDPTRLADGGRRWVTVPRFALAPIDPRIETIDQSRLAVAADPAVRR